MEEQLNEILITLQRIQLENQALRQDNEDVRNELNQLQAQRGSDIQYKEPKVSLPDKFDGTRNKFRGFLNQVRLIMQMQSNQLLEDFEALIKEFEATFGDVDKSRTAANKIRKLTQGTRPASSYASEFRQIASDLDWSEAALIDRFRTGLKNDVKDLLLTLEDPTSLNDAISKAVRCNNRLFERRQERSRDPIWGKGLNQAPSNHMNPLTEPMQIDTLRYKPLLDEEKNRRRANRLCLYCGEQGHIAKGCSNKSNPRPKIGAIVVPNEFSGKEQPQPQRPSPRSPTNTLTIGLSLHLSDGSKVKLAALIDSGASAFEVIDGREISSGNIIHETGPLLLSAQSHHKKLSFNLIQSPHYQIILGLPWLALHNPTINWRKRLITFSDPSCKAQCLNIPTSNPHQAQTYVVQVFTALASSFHPTEIPVIPEKYQDYSDVFNKKEANKLPESRPYDCAIDLLPDKQLPWG
ncbi:2024_t:CDS:2 [Cetraspora pellucida]|uniref:2024_t:CDS:1 n=1 Tax=Cetraspora pellucida TaxID=1433469 RepID=A0A9N9P347_9GLOM|nr:2024_t:CDS:2 [Cetraspora pellucida]